MLDPAHVPPVEPLELLARFVLSSRNIRQDSTVKLEEFMPHPHVELSVTRHRDATEDEIWRAGALVAVQRQRTLYGRADVKAEICSSKDVELNVVPDPLPENPNHANIQGWPVDKPSQKMKALVIASKSQFISTPV